MSLQGGFFQSPGIFVSALDFVLSEILFVYLPAEGQIEDRHCCRLAGELNGVQHLAKYFPHDKTEQNLKPRQEHFELVPPRIDQCCTVFFIFLFKEIASFREHFAPRPALA